jgi:hypothetical protein
VGSAWYWPQDSCCLPEDVTKFFVVAAIILSLASAAVLAVFIVQRWLELVIVFAVLTAAFLALSYVAEVARSHVREQTVDVVAAALTRLCAVACAWSLACLFTLADPAHQQDDARPALTAISATLMGASAVAVGCHVIYRKRRAATVCPSRVEFSDSVCAATKEPRSGSKASSEEPDDVEAPASQA